ncbi:MAG: hypothetical protein OXP12_04935 [Thaumarchaeota archaeon]|nr:hypothetical protein [Nitrososphaerota archaeon]MDE0266539.1 hypothetical protein [Nitrososphaerota archaeon]MDE0525157.1 hypothetical protein [Nitrososphaerota archaeon]
MDRVRRLSLEVLEKHRSEFGEDFAHNKKTLDCISVVRSKGLKNEIAGYITKTVKNEMRAARAREAQERARAEEEEAQRVAEEEAAAAKAAEAKDEQGDDASNGDDEHANDNNDDGITSDSKEPGTADVDAVNATETAAEGVETTPDAASTTPPASDSDSAGSGA